MATFKQPEYTKSIEAIMETVYTGAETDQERANAVEALVKQLGNTAGSIRSKLVRMKIYKKPASLTKDGKTPAKKAQLVAQIADEMDKEEDELSSLETANKTVLQAIISHYALLNRIIADLEDDLNEAKKNV